MNGWAVFFLAVIAVATLGTTIVQLGLALYAHRLSKQMVQLAGRVTRVVDEVERELKPLIANANAIGRDAAQAASMARAQVERADRICGDVVAGIDQTLTAVQRAAHIISPTREWTAILAGLRAAFLAFQSRRTDRRRRAEDEEALFI